MPIKRVVGGRRINVGPIKLYREDLLDIDELIRRVLKSGDHLTLTIDGQYELDGPDDFADVPSRGKRKRLREVYWWTRRFHVLLTRFSATVNVSNIDDFEAAGAADAVADRLRKRLRRPAHALAWPITGPRLALAVAIAFACDAGVVLLNGAVADALAAASVVIALVLFLGVWIRFRVAIIFVESRSRLTWWDENRNAVGVGIIVTAFGAVLAVILSKVL
jgi:hypothetical protein